jgi:hypothetical protein
MSDKVPCPNCANPTYPELSSMRHFGVCPDCLPGVLQQERQWREDRTMEAMKERGLGDVYSQARDIARRMFE